MTNQKKHLLKGKRWFHLEVLFFCVFLFSSKGCLVFGFQAFKNQQKCKEKMVFLVQNNLFPCVFCFWRSETKRPNTLPRETKKNKKNQGKQKKTKTLRWNHFFPVQKMVFWFQGYFLKSGNFVCFVTKSRNSASRYSTFVNTWFLVWIKYIIEQICFSPVFYNVFVFA